jgi:hypothetical protein
MSANTTKQTTVFSPPIGDVNIDMAPGGGFAKTGTFVANGASAVTVADPRVDASTIILIGLETPSGTVGAKPAVHTITPGTGFTVVATASDDSTYRYALVG